MPKKVQPDKKPLPPHPGGGDPTSNEALLSLPATYAENPDMPVEIGVGEFASLARAAKAESAAFARVGIAADRIELIARYGKRLDALERSWQEARAGVKLSAADRKQLTEAEALDAKLLAGGRWACRNDEAAQKELSRIAEGSGLTDTVNDLVDLLAFWRDHAAERKRTDITDRDLARAAELVVKLRPAAEKEHSDLAAAAALDLRNRCFWAGDELAKEIREGGRYAFRQQPRIASKFVSRYRASAVRRARKKAGTKDVPQPVPAPKSAAQ